MSRSILMDIPSISSLLLLFTFFIYNKNLIRVQAELRERNKTSASHIDSLNYKNLCAECKLTAQSIEDLVRKPRQVDSYGEVEDRIDLEKIKKAVCKDIFSDADRESCRYFYFKHEDSLRKWKELGSKISYFDFVCIKELKYCCPSNSFGPRCTKCLNCSFQQQCDGEGTRAGNGTCVCKPGHTGRGCSLCEVGYFNDEPKLATPKTSSKISSCKSCHRSCKYCRREGSLGCDVCRDGFTWISGFGCADVDECLLNDKICGVNTFCVNTEGSYFCYECDRACDGCHGDGPDMCLRCAKDYKLENENCVREKKRILPPEANYYRYAIYFGLCICTSIIFHNNVYWASGIGLGVAMYIGASEYVMSGYPLSEGREDQAYSTELGGQIEL